MPGSGFAWDDRALTNSLATLNARSEATLGAMARGAAAEAEEFMKQNAPWADNTGQARAALTAQAIVDGPHVAVVLAHGVAYGIFLETLRSGEDEIVRPTTDRVGGELMAATGRLWQGLLRQGVGR